MPVLVASAALAGLIWLLVYVRQGALMWGVLLFLLLNSAFGVYFWLYDGPLPLTLDRIALVGVIAAFILKRWLGQTEPKPLGAADYLLLALLAVLTFSTFTHDWRRSSEDDIVPMWRLFTGYLSPALIYYIGRQMRFEERDARCFLGAMALYGIYLSVTAFFEITQQWAFVFPTTIAEPSLGLHFGRARGPMLHSVPFGFYLGSAMVAGWLWFSRQGRWGLISLSLVMPLYLAGLYFSYTRSVWIGAAASLALILAATLQGSWRPVVLGAAMIAGLLGGTLYWDKFMGFEREYSASGTRESATLRSSFAYVSWQMFLDHPLLGCGFGQFYVEKLPYLSDRSTELELEAIRPLIHHNMPLALLTETGLIGFSLFVLLLVSWGVAAWRVWFSDALPDWMRVQGLYCGGVMAVYVPQALFHEVSYMNMVHMLLFFTAGLTIGCYQHLPADERGKLHVPSLADVRAYLMGHLPAARGDEVCAP